MNLISQLLEANNSELGRYLRYGLQGLHAALELALKEANSDDEGITACRELVQELDQLLQEDGSDKITFETVSNSHSPKLVLQQLSDAFFEDETLHSYLGDDLKCRSNNDSDLWEEIQKLLLRVPNPIALEWRQKALELAQKAGAEATPSNAIQLPSCQDALLYPGLSGTVNAKGLCLSTEVPLNSKISDDNLDEDLRFLAQVVSICLHFIETDPCLQHCLKSINPFAIVPFDDYSKKENYNKILIRRFQGVQKSENNPVDFLKTRLALDEAINSLVYLPLVTSNSWWGKLQKDARNTLKRAFEKVRNANNGHDVRFQLLLGSFDDILNHTENDVMLRSIGDEPGKVTACLRVYASIDEEELLGRVIYCPK